MQARGGSGIGAAAMGERLATRRDFLVGSAKLVAGGSLAAALAARGVRGGLAQGATPGAAGAGSGYPELNVTITDEKYELSADSVAAGYVLLTVTNKAKDATGAAVIGPPPGMSMQDMMQMAATPPAEAGGFPPFLYQAAVPGGPGEIEPGGTAQAIIKLEAGDWAVFGEGNQPPTFFTATAGTPAGASEPAAAVTVTEEDFAFAGLDHPLAAGKQTWKVVNAGKQPHMLVLGEVPVGTTMEQVMQVVMLPDGATPSSGALQEKDFQGRGGILLQSAGTTVCPMLDLPAGRYVALCFVTDPNTGKPHAMEGMVSLFDVGTAGTPAS